MKKFITVALAVILALCLIAGFTACGTKSETVRALMITGSDGLDYNDYYLGDFYYKKSADESGAYPDPGTVNFKVQYEDGSTKALAADSPELKLAEITKNGEKVSEAPVLYDVGTWAYVYEYMGARASVSFNILPALNASYEITGLPSSWVYSAMPSLTETISVSGYPEPLVYYGENANAQMFYITTELFENEFAGVVMDEDKMQELESASLSYYPFDLSGNPIKDYINAGEYYFYLKLSASGNFAGQTTNLQKVTVEKEILDIGTLPTLNESYKFYSYNGPGNVKISDVLNVPSYSFTTTNKGGETVKLITSGWMDPDDEISVGTPDKKYRISLSPDTAFDNYDTDNLYMECTVSATAGYVQSNYDTFSFGDAEQLVLDRDVEIDECTQNGLKFFNSIGLNNNEALLESYFRMVKVVDENGKKLPVYAENSDTPLYAGDDGAIGKIVRTTDGSMYDYRIILNENALGDYTFTVSLIDNVNFYWGTSDNNYGIAPIILNYSVVANEPYVYLDITSVNVSGDGKLKFDLYITEAAFDESLVDTLQIVMDESYTDAYGNVSYTTDGITIDTDNIYIVKYGTSEGRVQLKIELPVTITSDNSTFCFTVKMQTAGNYSDVNVSTYTVLTK